MLVFCLIHILLLVPHFSYAYFLTCLICFNLFHWLLLKLVVILALFTFRLVLFFCMLLVTRFTVVNPHYLVCFTCLLFLFDSLFIRFFFYRSYLLIIHMLLFYSIHILLRVLRLSYASFLNCLICLILYLIHSLDSL
jgi:hypothetical protein